MTLTLRHTWPDRPFPKEDWLVFDDGVEVGRIELDTAAYRPEAQWSWALSGAADRAYQFQFGARPTGHAPSLEDAKAGWRAAYERWLAWKAEHPDQAERRGQ
jgi:hypothetical protein